MENKLTKEMPRASEFLHFILDGGKDVLTTLKEFLDKHGISYDTLMEVVNDILVAHDFAPIVFEHSVKTIIQRLSYATHGTEKNFFTKEEIENFAVENLSVWDKNTSDFIIAEAFVDFWRNTDRECERCGECGKLMREGCCMNIDEDYYCSIECLRMNYSREEYPDDWVITF